MRFLKFKIHAVIFLAVLMMFWTTNASAGGVEIEFGGLSPAAQKAIKDMSMQRQKIKTQLESPMTQLNNLKETYRSSCGQGKPTDEGCETLFNQIIDAHRGVMQTISGFLSDYNRSLKIVVEELDPQIRGVAFDNTPSDIMDDLVNKWSDVGLNVNQDNDPFVEAIVEAFGLGEGETAFEVASGSYIDYNSELKRYENLNTQLQRKILQAEKRRNLGLIINDTTKKELASLTTWIYGKERAQQRNPDVKPRTTLLR